jgi:hypothetical protein
MKMFILSVAWPPSSKLEEKLEKEGRIGKPGDKRRKRIIEWFTLMLGGLNSLCNKIYACSIAWSESK